MPRSRRAFSGTGIRPRTIRGGLMSGFTPLLFAYVFTAVFLAGIVRGATGFGFSIGRFC